MDRFKRKTSLIASLLASLLFHGGALVSLRHYPFTLVSTREPLFEPLSQEDTILEEAFQQWIVNHEPLQPHPEGPLTEIVSVIPAPTPLYRTQRMPVAFKERAPLPFSPKMHLHLFVPLGGDSLSASIELPLPQERITPLRETEKKYVAQPVRTGAPQENKATLSVSLPTHKTSWESSRASTSDTGISWSHLPSLPSLHTLKTLACSDAFDVDLVFTPLEGEEGVLFALTLIPCEELPLQKMRQNYLFLIDRSNSIQKERLLSTQQAVARALEDLDPEDTFNIFVFDSRMEKFSSCAKQPTSATLMEAKAFLNHIQLGSFFSHTELSLPLFLSIPQAVQTDEVYTAILFTNGDTLKKRDHGASMVRDWLWQNQGRVSLYTVSMSGDPSLGTLETLSALSRGQLISYSGKRALKRKMMKLMKSIHSPLVKQVSYCGITSDKENTIEFFPGKSHAPTFYLDQPYVLLGKARTLDDFVLFIQGRCNDQWVNIRKTISFLSAKKASTPLKAEWALHSAHQGYETYLRSGRPDDLRQAHEWVIPYHLPTAFEAP